MFFKKWLSATLFLLAPFPAFAHPHIFVDARLEVLAADLAEKGHRVRLWRRDAAAFDSLRRAGQELQGFAARRQGRGGHVHSSGAAAMARAVSG